MISAKAKRRTENKKRKVAAFLQVASLNDEDRAAEKKRKCSDTDDSDVSEVVPVASQKEEEEERKPNARLTSKPLLDGDEYQALRAQLRARKKALVQLPKFRLKSIGEEAIFDAEAGKCATPLIMSDLHQLLLYSMVGDKAPYEPMR
jgi:hypothetical protein